MQLLCASHWLSEDKEEIKIPQGLKAYYQYRYNRYTLFALNNKDYLESHTLVGKMLGISCDTIKRVYNPLLKRMGLIETVGTFEENNINYIVHSLDALKGDLINYELEHTKLHPIEHKRDKDFSYTNMKALEHNKRLAQSLRSISDNKMVTMTQERYLELSKLERELKEVENNG